MTNVEVFHIASIFITVGFYLFINRWQHKEIKAWKDAYYKQADISDQVFVYMLELNIREAIRLEDFTNAAKLRDIKNDIIKNNPEADLIIRK